MIVDTDLLIYLGTIIIIFIIHWATVDLKYSETILLRLSQSSLNPFLLSLESWLSENSYREVGRLDTIQNIVSKLNKCGF